MTEYDALAELAQLELDAVSAGATDRLAEIGTARAGIVAGLPGTPPPEARPALERAAALQTRVSELLGARVSEAGTSLRKVSQGRTAMAGYAVPDERAKLVDRAG